MFRIIKNIITDFGLFAFVLLLISVPIMLNTPESPLFQQPLGGRVQLADFAFILLFASFMLKIFQGKITLKAKNVHYVLLLYILCSLPSFMNSINVKESIVEFASIVYTVLLFALLIEVIRSKERLHLAVDLWIFTSIAVASLGVLGIFLACFFKINTFLVMEYKVFPYLGHVFRARSTFMPNAKFLSSYLTIGIPLTIWKAHASKNKKERNFWIISLCVLFLALFFTFSRGWLGLAVCLCLMMTKVQNASFLMKFAKNFLLLFVIVFGIFIICISLWEPVEVQFNHYYDKEFNVVEDTSIVDPIKGLLRANFSLGITETHYLALKKFAYKEFLTKPYIGIGLGTFRDKIAYLRKTSKLPEKFPLLDPHCTFLGRLAETGILGLFSLLMVWVYFLKYSFNAHKAAHTKHEKFLAWTFFSILVAFTIQGIDMDIMNFRFLWFTFALTYALKRLSDHPANENDVIHKKGKA